MGSIPPNSTLQFSFLEVLIPRRKRVSHGSKSQAGREAAFAYGSDGGGRVLLFEWGDDSGLVYASSSAANEIGLASRSIRARITGVYHWWIGCDDYRRSSFQALWQQDDHDHCCDLYGGRAPVDCMCTNFPHPDP